FSLPGVGFLTDFPGLLKKETTDLDRFYSRCLAAAPQNAPLPVSSVSSASPTGPNGVWQGTAD
ncbi:MAG: hypothetical protein ACREXG_15595, partial [Polaromonas sp.]